MNISREKSRLLLVITMVIFAVVLIGYMFWSGANPTPEQLAAQAARSEALAKEYEGESKLVESKATLVSAYPDTLREAGLAAVKLGTGAFLVVGAVGLGWLLFSLGTSLMIRSSAHAYEDAVKARIVADLQFQPPNSSGMLSSGDGDPNVIDLRAVNKSNRAKRTPGGGPAGAVQRYKDTLPKSDTPAGAGTAAGVGKIKQG